MRVRPNDADVRAVTNAIGQGRENAVRRSALAAKTGLDDRTMRSCIEAARRDGVFIVSSNDGYYIASETEEVERQYRIDHARALSILARLTPMRQYLRAAGVNVK